MHHFNRVASALNQPCTRRENFLERCKLASERDSGGKGRGGKLQMFGGWIRRPFCDAAITARDATDITTPVNLKSCKRPPSFYSPMPQTGIRVLRTFKVIR